MPHQSQFTQRQEHDLKLNGFNGLDDRTHHFGLHRYECVLTLEPMKEQISFGMEQIEPWKIIEFGDPSLMISPKPYHTSRTCPLISWHTAV